MERHADHGRAAILMVAVVACCALAAIAVGRLGGALADRQQARTAADAAALAGVDGGRPAAAELARRNGGSLIAYVEHTSPDGSRIVDVTVSVDGVAVAAQGDERALSARSEVRRRN